MPAAVDEDRRCQQFDDATRGLDRRHGGAAVPGKAVHVRNAPVGDAHLVEQGAQGLARMAGKARLDATVEFVAVLHALGVARKTRIGGKVRLADDGLAEDLPLALVLDGNQDLAVARGEDAVRRDRGMGEPQPARFLAAVAAGEVGHVHVFGDGVEQRQLDVAPNAAPLARDHRLQDRRIGRLAGRYITDGDAHPARA
jgi:hypothetical protein